jgi:uncharacterized protein (TIGR03086 family)
MDMDADEFFTECLARATSVVKQVRAEQFSGPTPDIEWTVHDLAGHMLYELSWVPDVIAGRTMQEVGDIYDGDLIGSSDTGLVVQWENAATKAEEAVAHADLEATAHLSYGDVTVAEYLHEAGADQLIHAWDLGQAIGVSVAFDEEIAQAIYDRIKNEADIMHQSGLFAPPKEVPADADLQTKLLALYGRSADTWRKTQ